MLMEPTASGFDRPLRPHVLAPVITYVLLQMLILLPESLDKKLFGFNGG